MGGSALSHEQVGVTTAGGPVIADGAVYVGSWNHGNAATEGFYAYHLPGTTP